MQDYYSRGAAGDRERRDDGRFRNGGYQYLWSPRYIDAPILRDTLTTDGSALTGNGDRMFYTSDANNNVTSLVGYVPGSWQVMERYTYDPYGVVTVRGGGNWVPLSTNTSTFGNTLLYTGKFISWNTLLYDYEARTYDPAEERFISTDPITYRSGDFNLYRYVRNNPLIYTDPLGKCMTTANCVATYSFRSEGYQHFWTTDGDEISLGPGGTYTSCAPMVVSEW